MIDTLCGRRVKVKFDALGGRQGQVGVIEDDMCRQTECSDTVWVEFETDNEDGPEPFPMTDLELLDV